PRAGGPGSQTYPACPTARESLLGTAARPGLANASVSDARNLPRAASQRKIVIWTADVSMVTTLKLDGRPPRVRVESVPAVETATRPCSTSALSCMSLHHCHSYVHEM